MKDIRLLLEQIHNKSEVNESALSKLGWGAALVASGALGIVGADTVIKNKRSSTNTTQTQPVQTQPVQTQPVQTQPVQTQPTYADDRIQKMIRDNEGFELRAYKDTNQLSTIGIGHNLQAAGSLKTFKTVFGQNEGEKLHTGCVNGTCGLTKDQAEKLFQHDYITHRNFAVERVPKLHTVPPDVQAVIVDAFFRGKDDRTGPGPRFIEHFNASRWEEAAAEYIDRREYKKPKIDPKTGKPIAPGVLKRLKQHYDILQNFADSQKSKSGTVTESCGCKHKSLKSRMRKKIMQRLEEAKFALIAGPKDEDKDKDENSKPRRRVPNAADIKDLIKMGLMVDFGDTTEQATLDTFDRLYGDKPPIERDPTSFLGHEPSAAQRGHQRQTDVRGTGKSQTRKPAIHINGFDTLVVPPEPPSFFGANPFELHSIHTPREEQVSNPRDYKFTVTSRIATRQVDDKGNPYHPHAGQAIHAVRDHKGRIMAVFKGGHDRPLEQIPVNDDHWIQQSAGMILDPEEGYNPVAHDHDGEHAENAAGHLLFGRTERPEDRVSLFYQAINKHLNAKVKMGLGIPLKRVRDVLAQHTDPPEG